MYACVRTDNMEGTTLGKYTVSLKVENDIENGSVVILNELVDREVYSYKTPTGEEKKGFVLIATPEVVKEKSHNTLSEFINKAGTLARGYVLVSGDMFSLTKEGFKDGATLAKDSVVELDAGTKLNAVVSGTEGKTAIGKIIAVEGTWYVVKVD